MQIKNVTPRLILNSQGKKAVECTIALDNGNIGTFAPPAGTSVGKYEAKTVNAETAAEQIKKISPELTKFSKVDQHVVDEFTKNKASDERIGANTTLAISIAYAIAADSLDIKSQAFNKSLKPGFKKPQLMVLFFEGGVHASSNVKVQEYMCVYDDIFKAAEDYHAIKTKLEKDGHFVNCGMEGGMVSEKLTDEKILEILHDKPLALDIGGHYLEDNKAFFKGLALEKSANIVSVEDPYPEDEGRKWQEFYNKWHEKMLIVGDDLTVTNKERIKKFANNAINAVIIKPNQQYALTDTLEAIKTAKDEGLKTIVSHRSGETNQTFVADLAIATQANYVKFGAPVRGERVVKYNRIYE